MSDQLHTISAILFDLGGVLVDWDGTTPIVELTNGRLNREQARRFWIESAWVGRFERGLCTAEEFAAGCVKDLGVSCSPQEFIARFATWDRGPFAGAAELLEECRRRGLRLYCLSNNNSIHWANPGIQSLVKHFERVFVSFETRLMKPDSQAFRHVLAGVQDCPAEILFLDDNPECIAAARAEGLMAEEVRGVAAARAAIFHEAL